MFEREQEGDVGVCEWRNGGGRCDYSLIFKK